MLLRLSFAARDRRFAKAMRRIRPIFDALINDFAATILKNPIHEAILVGVTDGQPFGSFEEISNNDGFFQVFAGCDFDSDQAMARQLFKILRTAVERCPFSEPDGQAFDDLFRRHEALVH